MLKEEQNQGFWDCGDFVDEVATGDEPEEQLCNTVLLTGPPGVGKTASVSACALELGFKVFEVNCSSRRSGQEVLAQLKEATQSHLVEASGTDALKPAFFNGCSTIRRSPKNCTLPVKTTSSTSKTKTVKKRCKKKENSITLTSFFKTKAKADYLYQSKSEKSAKKCAHLTNEKPTLSKNMATSLILFEEVDVVFEDEVGFLAAVKTFMKTSKRPVILTTTDPLFRGRFGADLDEIIFQTPSMADVCSYLQLVCLAEDVLLDSVDVSALFTVTRGDVRQSLLQLQLWANSGRGHRFNERDLDNKGCSSSMLGLQDIKQNDLLHPLHEQQVLELIKPLVESWRNGFPMLYSNLNLLHVDTKEHHLFHPHQMKTTQSQYSTRSDAKTQSRLSRKKYVPSLTTSANTSFSPNGPYKADCSADKIGIINNLGALSDFFDLMSFIDASMPLTQKLVAPCQVETFVATEAKIVDGHLDEMREDDDESQEMILDIRATLEALGFLRCQNSSQRRDVLSNTGNLNFVNCPNIRYERRADLGRKVLCSRYFSLLNQRRAVCIDYLPVLRFFCRTHRKQQKQRTEELIRSVKSLKTQLRLDKKTVDLLAGEFS